MDMMAPPAQPPLPGPDAAPPMGGAPPVPPGPTGPATQAPVANGQMMAGKAKASIAMKMLAMALVDIGADSAEGAVIAKMLADGGKAFKPTDNALDMAEMKVLGQTMGPGGGGPGDMPGAGAKQRLGQMGMGAPDSGPPPMAG